MGFSQKPSIPCLFLALHINRHKAVSPQTRLFGHTLVSRVTISTLPRLVDMSRDNSADPFQTDAATLSHYSDSRENASRLMDDLELLRIERQVSNAEREKDNISRRRSNSRQHHHHDRHNPEAPPEDAFHTLTEPTQLPQITTEPEPTALGKLFKKLRRFPRVIRYFVYVRLISSHFWPAPFYT